MKKLLAAFTASVLTFTVLFSSSLSVPSAETAAADTVKIMPVGDSITNGDGDPGGYRKFLDYALKQKGISFDLVGPKSDSNRSFTYNGQTVEFDSDHSGYSGFQIKEVPDWGKQQGNTGSLYNQLKNSDTVKKYSPDIILLMIGTNDMTANRSMSACASDLHDLVDYMLGDLPSGGAVFLGSIPEFTQYGGTPEKVASYNSTVKQVADDYAKAGKNVRFCDVHGCLDGMNDIGGDRLHPNSGGYEKIGKFWAEQIADYLGSGGTDTPPDTPDDPADPPETPDTPEGTVLLNSDFESGLSGWSARGSASVETTKKEYAAGSASASVTGRQNDWNGIAYTFDSSTLPAGAVISVRAQVMQKSGSSVHFKMTMQYDGTGGTEYDTFAEGDAASGKWITLSADDYTVKSGSNPILYFETQTDKSDFYLDNVTVTVTGGAVVKPPANYKLGDVDGSGTINAADLSLAKQCVLGKVSNSTQKKMSDVNCDGTVDLTDIKWFVDYLTARTKELPEPVGKPAGEMRTISEYTAAVKDSIVMKETNESVSQKAGVTYPQVQKKTYFSKKANKEKNYNILLPANYDESKEYPVLYVLHGFFENEDRMIVTGNNPPIRTKEIICNAIASGDAEEMIVVVPFVFTSATMNDATGFADPGSNEGYDNFVDDIADSLMPHIESTYSVATGRENTAVTGFSMGGRESLQIGMKYADKFGYVGAICPAPGVSGSWKWESEEAAPSLVLLTGGTEDDVVGLSTPQGYHDNFDKAGTPHIWHVVQGGHHGDDSILAHMYNFVRLIFKA